MFPCTHALSYAPPHPLHTQPHKTPTPTTPTPTTQPIGVVVADTEAVARDAVKLVKVEYEDLPAIYTIQDAIAAGSFFKEYGGGEKVLQKGRDVDEVLAECVQVVEGDMSLGGQEHFYLEPQCAVIMPVENDEFVSIASTQVCVCGWGETCFIVCLQVCRECFPFVDANV